MNAHDFWLKILKDCYEFDFPNKRKIKVVTFPTDRGLHLQYHDMVNDLTRIGGRDFSHADRIMDVGACVGMWAMWTACLYPDTLIYAYEPMPHNFDNLCENIKLNGFENILPVNHAISSDGSSLTLYQHPLNAGSGSISLCNDKRFEPYLPVYECQSKTMKQAMDYFGMDDVSFVKMDIEGSEYSVLDSLDAPTWNRIKFMSLELHGNDDQRLGGISQWGKNEKIIIV